MTVLCHHGNLTESCELCARDKKIRELEEDLWMAKIGLPEIIENREQTIEELRQALADIVTSCFYLNGNDGAINSSWMDEINLAEKVQPGTAKIMREILAAKDSAV